MESPYTPSHELKGAFEPVDHHERAPICIDDYNDAREFVAECYEKGERPIVTVPAQYAEALADGLRPHTTWVPNLDVIAATFARDPYIPAGEEDRIKVELRDVPLQCIKPRFTGSPPAFRGVVVVEGPIAPHQLKAA